MVGLTDNDVPILWNSFGQRYNPDFIVVGTDDVHWVVEVKADKDLATEDVQGKRQAARRWANHVSAADEVGVTWRYLLAAESDVTAAKGSWPALKSLGS
jgi:type III restriction enzyme